MTTLSTSQQIIRFNTLLNKLGLQDMKRDIIAGATNGRTESTRAMTNDEINQLIERLNGANDMKVEYDDEKSQKKRRRILSICHQLPLHLGFTRWDGVKSKRVVDLDKLDSFLESRGKYKKGLQRHSNTELSHVIVQFEGMLKSYIK